MGINHCRAGVLPMNYQEIASLANEGIEFFSDENGSFNCITQAGSVRMVGGVEVEQPEVTAMLRGFVRNPRDIEVNGDTIRANDKLGCFTNAVPLMAGFKVDIDGERYEIINPRPVRQTATTVAYRPVMRRIAVNG